MHYLIKIGFCYRRLKKIMCKSLILNKRYCRYQNTDYVKNYIKKESKMLQSRQNYSNSVFIVKATILRVQSCLTIPVIHTKIVYSNNSYVTAIMKIRIVHILLLVHYIINSLHFMKSRMTGVRNY